MAWSGDFTFGDYWLAFRGRSADNDVHSHAALQISVAPASPAILTCGAKEMTGRSLIVKPGVKHCLHPIDEVQLIFLEPQSPLAQLILRDLGSDDILELPEKFATRLKIDGPLESCLDDLLPLTGEAPSELDFRLQKAIAFLDEAPFENAIAGAAMAADLSESRLRSLANEELGVPLSKWLIWRKLRRAAKELKAGADLAEAAYAGGFSDQAHFSRTMRNVIGLTPGMAAGSLG